MKIVERIWVIGSASNRFAEPVSDVEKAILATKITLRPVKKGNGVKPIKHGVVARLTKLGWDHEHGMDLDGMRAKPLDAFKEVNGCKTGLEWETGNISSSFRAMMKLIKGMVEGPVHFGIHVLPSRNFYQYLTDRIGNISELRPYLPIFGRIKVDSKCGLLILVVEHDSESARAPLIPKGLDGMSLRRRGR